MNIQVRLAVLALCLVTAQAQTCGKCVRSDCPTVRCTGGKTFDACRCCRGCTKQVGESCRDKSFRSTDGYCANGLVCSYPEDTIGEAGIMISHHKFQRPGVCVRTYANCQKACADGSVPTSSGHMTDSGKSVMLAPSFESAGFWAYCDCSPGADKAWMVIQRRASGLVNFNGDFQQYERGFGLSHDDFWLGLNRVHKYTSSAPHEAMIVVQYDTYTIETTYKQFQVGDAGSSYRLTLRENKGDGSLDFMQTHHGMKFSTYDEDNDNWYAAECAEIFKGGWWYNQCTRQNLNGEHYGGYRRASSGYDGPDRVTWNACSSKQVSAVEIRIRLRT